MKTLDKIFYRLSNSTVVSYSADDVFEEEVDLLEVKKDAEECLYLYKDGSIEMSVKNGQMFVAVEATEQHLTMFQLAQGSK